MRKIRDVLRLTDGGMSSRQVAASLGIEATTVIDFLGRAQRAGIAWSLPDEDEAPEAPKHHPERLPSQARRSVAKNARKKKRRVPNLWDAVHVEIAVPRPYAFARCDLPLNTDTQKSPEETLRDSDWPEGGEGSPGSSRTAFHTSGGTGDTCGRHHSFSCVRYTLDRQRRPAIDLCQLLSPCSFT
jgi:hypothetical protein